MQKIKCHNSVEIPIVGLGLYRISEQEMDQVIYDAYLNGYRHFDTAQMYENEEALGRAWRKLAINRQEIMLTSKIHDLNQGYEKTLKSFQESCSALQSETIDQVLIHWPGQNYKRTEETWKALEKLYEEGLVSLIGLSNFTQKHISIIEKSGNIKPMTNQIERNPLINQLDLISSLHKKEILPIAWAPLRRGNLNFPVINELAEKYQKTPAQIILRWNVQSNVIVIPRSSNKKRQIENINIFDFELTQREVTEINNLHTGERTSHDPAVYDF